MRNRKRRGPGSRMLFAAAVVAALGLCAGAAVPGSAHADDDDNGDNGGNVHQCSGTVTPDPNPNDNVTVQVCTITPAHGTNEICIQRSSDAIVRQTCIFTQAPAVPASSNRVTVIQIADQHGAEGTLDAEQKVQGQQSNTTGHNIVNVSQVIKQVLASGIDDDDDGDDDDDNGEADEDDDGEPDDDNGEENGPADLTINQFEQAHQSVDLCQGGVPCENFAVMLGRNRSTVYQSQKQHEFAANATVVNQGQNVEARLHECSPGPVPFRDDPRSRTCYTIGQYTSNASQSLRNPANFSKLTQYSEQLQNVRDAGGGNQRQGEVPLIGGLDHNFVQFTPPPEATSGIALLLSDQDEYQTQRATSSPLMTQDQFGNLRKGSGTQHSNPNSLVDIEQDKTQYQGEVVPPTGQTGAAQAFAETSGDCVADVTVTQNGESASANEPSGDAGVGPDICDESVFCGEVDEENGEDPFPGVGECVSSDEEFVDGVG